MEVAATRPGIRPRVDLAAQARSAQPLSDGIPLAIELAAVRVKTLAVDQILARLADRFRLLTGGRRAASPRHQKLRAAIDWSFKLLSEAEQVLLRRLAVFADGWTLEAAEAICSGNGVTAVDILDLLARLVDKSLVAVDMEPGIARYRLLETVRQYGRERLQESGEVTQVRTRHRTWYLDLAERADTRMHGPEQTMWLDRLEVEHDNLRAALGWSSTKAEDPDTRLRLAGALYQFWVSHTHLAEGRKWLETALAGSRNSKSVFRVRALHGAGQLALSHGDDGRAMVLFDECLALARELGDQRSIAKALRGRGSVIMRQRDFDAATALFEQSLELFRKLEDKWWVGLMLGQMGWLAGRKGDYTKAQALYEESLAMFRTLGGTRQIALALVRTGDYVRLQGDLERAAGLYKESLALFGEVGDKWIATECFGELALIASTQGNHERAAHLFGVAEAARETFAIPIPRPDREEYELLRSSAREGLGSEAFAAAWAEGRAMTLEQAIEYALAASDE